jgi:hypothetical protein
MACDALSLVDPPRPGAKPFEPFGKGSNALKAGTRDDGRKSPAALGYDRVRKTNVSGIVTARPSVQLPAGGERKGGLIEGL